MLLKESFRLNSLPYEDRDKIYNIFRQSYEKATGHAWNRSKFDSRASEWLFFGDTEGFITVRPQRSGFYKLTGVAGGRKGIMKGLQELADQKQPTWAMLTPELANILIKRYGFRKPNKLQAYLLGKLINSNVFGNVEYTRNKDGSITFKYGDVGEATKVFVGNDEYFQKLKKDVLSRISWRNILKGDILKEEDNLNELRAVSSYSEENLDALKKYLKRNGYDNIYVSFRDRATTNWVNPRNQYGTPTGFYCYPVWKFSEEKLNSIKSLQDFKSIFPYHGTNPYRYMVLFKFDNYSEVVRSENTDQEKVNMFVDRVRENWKGDERVQKICDDYVNGTLRAYYPNGDTTSFKNEFQKLWLFMYTVAKTVGYSKLNHGFTRVANAINLSGFVDDGCTSVIHGGEPCQAVFFPHAKNGVKDQIVIDSHQVAYDAPMDIDRDNQGVREFVNKYSESESNSKVIDRFFNEIFRAENIVGRINREVMAAPTSVKHNLLRRAADDHGGIGKIAFQNGGLVYLPKNQERESNKQRFEAFIAKKLGVNKVIFDKGYQMYVNKGLPFFVTYLDPKDGKTKSVFINQRGEEDVTGLNVDEIKDSTKALAAYINTKYGTSYLAVYNFGYADNPNLAMAQIAKDGSMQTLLINREGQPDISGLSEKWMLDHYNGNEDVGNWYFSQKFGRKVTGLVSLSGKGLYITDEDHEGHFVNMAGMDDLSHIEPKDITSHDMRAAFFNQKFGTKYTSVRGFSEGNNFGLAKLKEGKEIFINDKGEPDISEVNANDLPSKELALYFNQKNGTDYIRVDRIEGDLGGKKNTEYLMATNNDGQRSLINKDGFPDTDLDIDINLLDAETRAVYINQKYGRNWRLVGEFGSYGGDVAPATTGSWTSNDIKFIDREGNLSTKNVYLNKVDKGGDDIRAAFINQKYGTDWRKIGPFKNGELAYAFDRNDKKSLINKKGSTDISKADLEKIRDTYMRAEYINKNYNKDFKSVGEFGQYGEGVAVATAKQNDKKTFITPKGNPSIKTVDFDKINETHDTNLIAAYFRQKYGTEYVAITYFGRYEDPNITKAYIEGTATAQDIKFINKEGELDTGTVKIENISSGENTLMAALMNQKYGTNYKTIRKVGDGYIAKTQDDEMVFVNATGSPDTENINLYALNPDDKAKYFKQRYGKDYNRVLSYSGENDDDPKILVAITPDEKSKNIEKLIFINEKGEPDTSVITPKHVSYLSTNNNSNLLPAYFNQKTGRNYNHINRIGTYPLYYAKYLKDGKRETDIINIDGEKSLDGLSWEVYNDLGSQIRTAFVNQKFGTNFAETNHLSNENVFFAEKFVDDKGYIEGIYLNTEGKPDVSGVSMEEIIQNPLRLTAYINTNFGKDYRQVVGFNKNNGLVSVAYTKDGKLVHINLEGEPVDYEAALTDLSSKERLEYFKTKFGKEFAGVTDFIYGAQPKKSAIAAAKDVGSSNHYFINQKGEPTLDGVDEETMKNNQSVVDLTKKKIAELEQLKKSKTPKKKDDPDKINEMIIDEILKLL